MTNYFALNREKIFNKMQDNSCILLNSGTEKHKSGDANYPFCVNKNFYYLTGLEKPGIYLIMVKKDQNCKSLIYTPQYEKSAWVTPSYTITEALKISRVDEVAYYQKTGMTELISEIMKTHSDEQIYTDFMHKDFYEILKGYEIYNCYDDIAKARAVKSQYEIKQIEKAIDITHKGLIKLFENLSTCDYEYQAQALFEGEIKFHNSQDIAFDTICAGGKNACTLHYSKNTDKLNQEELLLLDLGARYGQFSADISRTIPYKSKFSPLQMKLYNMVLKAQKIGFKMAKPGVTIMEINSAIVDFYFEELRKMGLVKKREDVRKYYMHSIGHSLGLDTHDEGLLRNEKLVAGNVITMEPGIYIPEYRIGIRIEDDVLITETGNRVLSKKIPKSIEDIEKILK